MKNVKYVLELCYNLFSISTALKEGCYLEGNLKMIRFLSLEGPMCLTDISRLEEDSVIKIINEDEQRSKK